MKMVSATLDELLTPLSEIGQGLVKVRKSPSSLPPSSLPPPPLPPTCTAPCPADMPHRSVPDFKRGGDWEHVPHRP